MKDATVKSLREEADKIEKEREEALLSESPKKYSSSPTKKTKTPLKKLKDM
jgi:hypothetical protein